MKERKGKEKVKTAICVTFSLKNTILKFCCLCMPQLCKLIFCIWIRRLHSKQPVNGFVIHFSALKPDSDQKTAQLASIQFFLAKFPGANGLSKVLSCLRADVSYFLCCTGKRDVCVTPSLIVFQHPAGREFYFA